MLYGSEKDSARPNKVTYSLTDIMTMKKIGMAAEVIRIAVCKVSYG
jgi:hypothetical protein